MATVLVFFAAFVVLLSGAAPSLPSGSAGPWAVRALAFDPFDPLSHSPTVLLGRLATWLPVGAPAFRLNALAALLVAASVPLLIGFLRSAAPRGGPDLPLAELEKDRARDAAHITAGFLWLFSGPVRSAGAAWSPAAPALFFALLFVGVLGQPAARPNAASSALRGFLAGLALAAEPRALWAGAALLPLALLRRPRSAREALPLLAGAPAFLLGWGLTDAIGAALQSATAAQTASAFAAAALERARALRPALGPLRPEDVADAFGAWTDVPITALPLALWGGARLWKSNRPLLQTFALFWVFTTLGPRWMGPAAPAPGPSILPALPLLLLTGLGGADLLVSRPRLLPGLLALIPLTFALGRPTGARDDLSALDRGVNTLRSLPMGATLFAPSPATRSALEYQRRILRRRSDVTLVDGDRPIQAPPLGLFTESYESLPGGRIVDGWPEGTVVRYAPAGEWSRPSPLALSLGRVPFLFFAPRESPAPAGVFLAEAHARLGRAFYLERVMDEAATEFRRALALDPSAWDAHRDMARLCAETGDADRASEHFARAVRTAPNDATAAALEGERADAESAAGRPERALASLERGVARDPRNASLRERWADALEKAGHPADAARQWSSLCAASPEDKNLRWRLTLAWMMAKEPVRAFQAVDGYLGLPLTGEERAAAEEFRKRLAESAAPGRSADPG